MRAASLLVTLFVCAHAYPLIVSVQEEPYDDWIDPLANSSDWWDYPLANVSDWWDEQDNNATGAPVINTSAPFNITAQPYVPLAQTFLQSFLSLFTTHNESATGYIFITYIQMIPMIQCPEIDSVVQLFHSKIGEANPLAELATKALEYAGKPCNATSCTCDTDSRRKLAFKTLTVQTTSNVHKLRPAAKFPLDYETVSVM
jgi:hypothetical protein